MLGNNCKWVKSCLGAMYLLLIAFVHQATVLLVIQYWNWLLYVWVFFVCASAKCFYWNLEAQKFIRLFFYRMWVSVADYAVFIRYIRFFRKLQNFYFLFYSVVRFNLLLFERGKTLLTMPKIYILRIWS